MAELTEFEKWIEKKNSRRSKTHKKPAKESKNDKAKTIKPKRKRIRSKPKEGFSEEIRRAAHDRAGDLCENPLCRKSNPDLGGEHHCLPRSQYKKKDRNDLWNCSTPCDDCHARVTSPKTADDKRLRRYFERLAIARRDLSGDDSFLAIEDLKRQLRDKSLSTLRNYQEFTKKI